MGLCFQQLLPQLLTAKASRAFFWISIPYRVSAGRAHFQFSINAKGFPTPRTSCIYTPFQYELAGVMALEGAAVQDPDNL